jgi:hypothetical protein
LKSATNKEPRLTFFNSALCDDQVILVRGEVVFVHRTNLSAVFTTATNHTMDDGDHPASPVGSDGMHDHSPSSSPSPEEEPEVPLKKVRKKRKPQTEEEKLAKKAKKRKSKVREIRVLPICLKKFHISGFRQDSQHHPHFGNT